jgi:ribosomal protein S12 methylthiotransferase accessory factor
MGFCHYKLQQHHRAIDCFEKLIALDPSSAIDYANIASNYRAMGKHSKAIEYYQLALKLDDSIAFAKEHLEQLGVK